MPDTLGLLKASNAFLRCTKKDSSFLCKCVVADRGGRVEKHQSYLGTSVTTNNLTQSLLKTEVDLSVSKFWALPLLLRKHTSVWEKNVAWDTGKEMRFSLQAVPGAHVQLHSGLADLAARWTADQLGSIRPISDHSVDVCFCWRLQDVLLAGAMLSVSTGHPLAELDPIPALTRAMVFLKVECDSQFSCGLGPWLWTWSLSQGNTL